MLKSTNQPFSEAYSLALLDLDGVVYRGKEPGGTCCQEYPQGRILGMTVEYTTTIRPDCRPWWQIS